MFRFPQDRDDDLRRDQAHQPVSEPTGERLKGEERDEAKGDRDNQRGRHDSEKRLFQTMHGLIKGSVSSAPAISPPDEEVQPRRIKDAPTVLSAARGGQKLFL